jgi:hypothetical protein
VEKTIKISKLGLILVSLSLTPHFADAVATAVGSPDMSSAAVQYDDLLATPPLLLEPGMTKADLESPSKKLRPADMDPTGFQQSEKQSFLDFKYNANLRPGQAGPLMTLRPKLFISVNKNNPNPCDEIGRRAKKQNPKLVFSTMRLFDENGKELVYPEIDELSSFSQYSSDSELIFDYFAEYSDEQGKSQEWKYSDKRTKYKNKGNFLVKAPQYKEPRSCIYISTGDFGSGTDTPTGFFRPVNGRLYPSGQGDTTYVSRSYGDPMPWAVFYYNGYALHATGINNYQHIGGPASHGCLRQSVQDSHWVFNQIRKTWSTTPIASISKDGAVLAEKKKGYDTIISVQGSIGTREANNKNFFRSTEISTPVAQ